MSHSRIRDLLSLGPIAGAFALAAAPLMPACAPAGDSTVVRPPDTTTDPAVFDEKAMALTLADGKLALSLPIGNPGTRTVTGRYTLTLVSLSGTAIDTASGSFTAPPGGVVVPVTLDTKADVDSADLAAYNVRYKVTWPDDGKAQGQRSAFDTLKKVAVTVLTEDTIELGKAGHASLFVLDPATSKPIPEAQIDLIMSGPDGKKLTTRLVTDENGQANGELPAPAIVGDATLTVEVIGGGAHEIEEVPVKVVRSQKVLLTTDKPLYQPGQTIHLRALALRTHDKTPEANQDIVFEIEDGKGNLVARELAKTDAFGIGHTKIGLARQVNLGTWKLRALMGASGQTITEKTVTVDRYVLPKFKVAAALDQTWYRPGARVTVSGDARYFFGKAVIGGAVTITGATFDVDFTTFATAQTTTDANGIFSATIDVPAHVVGLPLEQGKGLMKIDVAVTDGADHVQTISRTASIAKGAIDVALVPESGKLVSGIANTVYVVTTDPDGGPVSATVTIKDGDDELAQVTTDIHGLGSVELVPSGRGTQSFDLEVTGGGETLALKKDLAVGSDTETILLRSDKAVYRTGDTVQLEVRLADDADKVWLDLVHDGRTAMLESLVVSNGVAHFAFDVAGDVGLAGGGELLVSAYTISDKGALVRDQRLLYVQPDDELKVAMTPRAASYKPGETATVDVAVTNVRGEGVAAAVGVQVVDEAVFALQEAQPGLLKVFFELARELSAPMVSPGCGGCDAESVITGEPAAPAYDDRARVAFAALSDMPQHGVDRNTFSDDVARVATVLKPFVDAEKKRVTDELVDRVTSGEITAENIADYLDDADVAGVDFWSRPWTVQVDADIMQATYTSAGTDERVATSDDLTFVLGYNQLLYRGWWGDDDGDFANAGGEGGPWPGAMPEGEAPQDPDVTGGGETGAPVKVRQDFPETLFVEPALITDGQGKASLAIDLADSITTWRMTGLASAQSGLLGSGTGGIVVFQDFFADVDFPVAMTRGDVLRVPVALYNYLETSQVVAVDLEQAAWFEAVGTRNKSITLAPGQVAAVTFDIRATQVGTQGLTVLARGSALSDAVRRTVTVRPDGKAFPTTHSARFAVGPDGGAVSETVTRQVHIPTENIDNAQSLLVKVFPGYMSQVVDGIDSLLRLPGGCFEQTTSSAWPNVLVTDYLNKTGAINEATEIKARQYISEGYQRLLTFECASGGFNWWEGDDPGNAILSAVGIMMFTDTKNVAFVDDGVIERAAKYLTATQQSDGSWTEERHLHSGNENLGAGSLRATAYIAWALQHAERESATVQKAIAHIRNTVKPSDDIYTKAMVVLALAMNDRSDSKLSGLLQQIHEARIEEGDRVHWSPAEATMVGGYNDSGDIETTAVVALALMQAQAFTADVQGSLTWLLAMKDPQGNWGYSTQATVLTLKALLASLSAGAPTTDASVIVKLDGQVVGERSFDTFNADVQWQLDLSDALSEGDHDVTLEYEGAGNFMWQIAGEHYLPWSALPSEPESPLAITVAYDKTQLAQDDVVTVTVTVSNAADTSGMMMAEVGLPPGFDVDTSLLDAVLGDGHVARYDKTALRLVVYLEPVLAGAPVTFQYQLRARYPLEATAPESETYLYYDKSVRAGAGPVGLVVQ